MDDPVYKTIEVIGTSKDSIEHAIKNAISRATQTVDCIHWFEVLQVRGNLENNSIRHYQVLIKIGFLIKS